MQQPWLNTPRTPQRLSTLDNVEAILSRAGEAQCQQLPESEAKRVLQEYGIPTTACLGAVSAEKAVELAEEIGYPVVLKALSPKIVHKSDVGGVKLGLRNAAEVDVAYHGILAVARTIDPSALVSVQEMAKPGVEVIIGAMTDPHFGPVIMFGLGGVFTELLEDVCFRLIPICRQDAQNMIASLKSAPLLTGYRGESPKDTAAVADILWRASELIWTHSEIIQLDLNPVIVHEKGAVVVDARAVLA